MPIEHLEITRCDFLAIDGAAFDGDMLASMNSLFIKYHQMFIFSPEAFDSLRAQDAAFLNIACCENDIAVIHSSDTLQPIRTRIKILVISAGLAGNFDRIFGAYKFARLNILHVEDQQNLHTLAYSNFTAFPVLAILGIKDCGIRAIMPNAFDYIGVTLIMLQLTGNELKTLPVGIFNVFVMWDAYTLIFLSINENPWRCDCDMIENKNVVYHSFRLLDGRTNLTRIPIINCSLPNPMKCPNIESLTPRKFCLTLDREYLFFPKFILKIDKETMNVYVAATIPRRYRLLIIDLTRDIQFQAKKPKCPTYNWFKASTKCFVSNNQTESIPLHGQGQIQIIMLNHIEYQRRFTFWPLHSVVYGQMSRNRDMRLEWTVFLLAAMVGTIVGMALTIVYTCTRTSIIRIYEEEYTAYFNPIEDPYDYAYNHMPKNSQESTTMPNGSIYARLSAKQ